MFIDNGVAYNSAWPTRWRGTELGQTEVAYYLDRIGTGEPVWAASKALKWGASPEAVAHALAAVAS